jgi:DNA repair protein RecO (recombination protein O)
VSVEWTDDAVVLAARPYGETQALLEVFARDHGRAGAIVHGGASRRTRPTLQAGNIVRLTWKARTADQLGFFAPVELMEPHAARVLDDAAALAALASATALVRTAAERQPYPGLYDALVVLLDAFAHPDLWPAIYTRFELGLLAELGYGIDLSACAVTGARDDLAWVSPRSGRAASRQAGAPYADKLLRLPPFLVDASAPLQSGDVADALALAGWFLERRLFDVRGEGLPDSRRRLIEALGLRGRL